VVTLQWDARGRARSAGPLHFEWSADDELLRTVVYEPGQENASSEERVYDAFGRAVQVVRDTVVLDRVYVGAEVVREVTECAERIWWPSGAVDAPGAYTVHWDRACNRLEPLELDTQLALVDLDAGLKQPVWNALQSADGVTFAVLASTLVKMNPSLLVRIDPSRFSPRR
jgi:hypothetical protein